MRGLLSLILVLFLSNVGLSQQLTLDDLQRLKQDIDVKKENSLISPESEVEDAIVFLSEISDKFPDSGRYVRFFTTYAIPEELREQAILATSFICHSLTGLPTDIESGNYGAYYPLAMVEQEFDESGKPIEDTKKFVPLRRVPGSDTLWWIDIRQYSWTEEAWEFVSKHDGYFVEPIVRYDSSELLRRMAGNAILRADWFILHTTDTSIQLDVEADQQTLYDTLLYAQQTKPATLEDWRKMWGVDLEKSLKLNNIYGTVMLKSRQVSRHNRMAFGYRSELGYMYETYDVKNERGRRDYIESFFLNKNLGGFPDVSDAGEMFATNHLGMQVYGLRDAENNIIYDGDTQVVRHINDVMGDVRVRMAYSCFDCHATGPLYAENVMLDLTKEGVNLQTYDYVDEAKIKSVFLSGKFRKSVEDNQKYFAESLLKVNGLTPEQNGQGFLGTIMWYNKPLDVTQAALECGVTEEVFIEKVVKGNIGGRLKLLVTKGSKIPRNVWEHPGRDGIPGLFQQAMLLIKGVTRITEEVEVRRFKERSVEKEVWYRAISNGKIMNGNTIEKIVQPGDEFKFAGSKHNGYVHVFFGNDKHGWLLEEKVERILK